MHVVEHIISIVAPHTCVGCGMEGALLCSVCSENLPRTIECCYGCHKATENSKACTACKRDSGLASVQAFVSYEGLAKQLVWRLKFERARRAGIEIGCLMAPLLASYKDVLVVPVPTATSRVRQRGYNQASVIARAAARKNNLQYAHLLMRIGQTRQVGGSRKQRREQIRDAFQVRRPELVKNAHIILIDDVLTTGATLEAAAATLKDAGAKKVEAVVFARA